MKISFIIPVYNTDFKRLIKCFDSINHIQNFEYETLIIDDGSHPSVGSVCKNYCNAHNNFRYIYKENGGVSSARNTGIKEAKGEFIFFVDSDDELISQNFFDGITFDYDLYFSDLIVSTKNGTTLWNAFDKEEGLIEVHEVIKRVIKDGTLNGPICKLIKKSFIEKNNILFSENMITGEDAVFLYEMIKHNPTMYYSNKATYRYILDDNTSLNRLCKSPMIFIDNHINLYKNKLQLTGFITDSTTKQQLTLRSTAHYIQQIFNICADLSLAHKFDQSIKEKTVAAINLISNEQFDRLIVKARIQYIVLKKRWWIVLHFIGILRNIYLSYKK